MVYNSDSQRAFSKQSKIFEASYASIVGMVNAKEQLVHDMEEVSALEGESMTKKFLSEAVCGDLQANIKCNSIENYEQAQFVVLKGVKLVNHADSPRGLYQPIPIHFVVM